MGEAFVDIYCRGLPGTARATPFGDEAVVWTVHGHMFACYTRGGDGVSLRIGDKVAAQMLIAHGHAVSAPYLKGEGWVTLPWATRHMVLRDHLGKSYRLVLNDRNG